VSQNAFLHTQNMPKSFCGFTPSATEGVYSTSCLGEKPLFKQGM